VSAQAVWVGQVLKGALLVGLLVLSVADVAFRSWGMLYSGDEVFNLDAILTLFSHADYTTRHFGGIPFDPVVSSGVLVTWLNGVVFLAGGTLFVARLLSGLLQFGAVVGLVFFFLRSRRLTTLDAAIVALSVWVCMLPVTSHEQRIVNAGEMWGFLVLAAGTFFVHRTPALAAFLWGLSAWLCKTIYVPFAIALVIGTAVSMARGHRVGSPTPTLQIVTRVVVPFLLPLAFWMGVIWLRYDFHTLIGWCSANVVFVVKHTTSMELSGWPTPERWRFDPQWGPASFLRWGNEIVAAALIPLSLGPVALGGRSFLQHRGRLQSDPRDTPVLVAALITVVLSAIWFLAFDPTQWGRHLLPAIYVSVAIALYCAVDIWQAVGMRSAALKVVGLAMYGLALFVASRDALSYIQSVYWKASYAAVCEGVDVLQTPCRQDQALGYISELMQERCGLSQRAPDSACMMEHRLAFLSHARKVMEATPDDSVVAASAGYMVVILQHWAYDKETAFRDDFSSVMCPESNGSFREYLRRAGIDMARVCQPRLPAPGGQAS